MAAKCGHLWLRRKRAKKQNKWKFGIIVSHSRVANAKRTARQRRTGRPASATLSPKRVLTRSLARRLNISLDESLSDSSVRKRLLSASSILNDDVLRHVLANLSLRDKFRVQRVSKQFCRVAGELLAEQRSLRIGNVDDYYAHCSDATHSTRNADAEDAVAKKYFYRYFYMNDIPASKERLSAILWKCPNVRAIELHNFQMDVETVKWLKWHALQLECLRLDEIKYDLTARKWSQVGQCLGDKLLHLHVDGRNIRADIAHLVQHLPLLRELCVRNYDQPVNVLLKRLPSAITALSLLDCEKLGLDSIRALVNNKTIARQLVRFELTVTAVGAGESANDEIFALVCEHLCQLRHLAFTSHSAPLNLPKLARLERLESLEISLTRDCFLDLSRIDAQRVAGFERLRSLKIHGSFFTPRMLESVGELFPNVERLSLTNWAFCCGCEADANADDCECPDCDEKCCQSLLRLERLRELYLEFLYSSDYVKPLILSLLAFPRLRSVTHVWYPVNASINSINFIDAIVDYGCAMAARSPDALIEFKFEKYVIALVDASKRLPRNLLIRCLD